MSPTRARPDAGQAGATIPANLADLVGNTPLVRLTRTAPDFGAELVGKLEAYNPAGSVKDRIGAAMIEAAEAEGRIAPGRTTIVEATSGNTGIALAFVAAAKGYDLVLTLPQGMSLERERLLRLYGAQVHVTESMGGMDEAVAAARALATGDGAGDVGRARREDRLPRGRRRHGWHHHRLRPLPQGAQRGDPRGRRRAAR